MLCGIFGIINSSGTMIDLKEGWHIYKIVEPVILTAVVYLVLTSSDRSGIFLKTDIVVSNDTR